MQKILLTRSVEENQILSLELRGLGFEPIGAPMISYEILPCDFGLFADVTDIIITSKFAAKIIAENYPHNVNCFIVGEESANIISQNPRINILYIANTAEELHDVLIKGLIAVSSQRRLGSSDYSAAYFSGDMITTEFEYAKRHIIYNVKYADKLEADVIKELESGVNYVLLYSKNCATNLIKLLKQYNLLQNIQNSVVIAMSLQSVSGYEKYVADILFPEKPKASEILRLLVEYDRENQSR